MQSSTGPSRRASVTRIVFALLAIAAVAYAGRDILTQWRDFRARGGSLDLRWSMIGASCLLVFTAYAILIETWRRVVRAWDSELRFMDAARIWFVSNLGRYIPGKVWQIAAMGALAQQVGVSPLAATGSSIIVNLVNLIAGFGLVLATGAALFDQPELSIALAVLLVIALALTPIMLPWIARLAGRLLKRDVTLPRLPISAIWIACVGCLTAWILYGVAFRLLVAGVMGSAPGPTTSYIAAFTGSYLLGYIALFSPGGLGVREETLIVALRRLGLGAGGPGILAVASRLWLTALEIVPGLLFLASAALKRRRLPTSTHEQDTNRRSS